MPYNTKKPPKVNGPRGLLLYAHGLTESSVHSNFDIACHTARGPAYYLAMTGQGISYFDAWSAWADGVDIRQRVLWGLEIYWWARASKIAILVAGLIIVLEIIGPERLQAYFDARRQQDPSRMAKRVHKILVILSIPILALGVWDVYLNQGWGSAFFVIPGVVSVYAGLVWLKEKHGERIGSFIIKALNQSTIARYARIISLALVLAAFHFDFLAS